MSGFGAVDLHMHSTVSDGTDSPAELLEQVKESGEEPKMKKDGSTGITLIDFTDLI